jgi:hypothetical protein
MACNPTLAIGLASLSVVLSPLASIALVWFTPFSWTWIAFGVNQSGNIWQFLFFFLASVLAIPLSGVKIGCILRAALFLYLMFNSLLQFFIMLEVSANSEKVAILGGREPIAVGARGVLGGRQAIYFAEANFLVTRLQLFRYYTDEVVRDISVDREGGVTVQIEVYGVRSGYESFSQACLKELFETSKRSGFGEDCAESVWKWQKFSPSMEK